jgi:hypothetical protein
VCCAGGVGVDGRNGPSSDWWFHPDLSGRRSNRTLEIASASLLNRLRSKSYRPTSAVVRVIGHRNARGICGGGCARRHSRTGADTLTLMMCRVSWRDAGRDSNYVHAKKSRGVARRRISCLILDGPSVMPTTPAAGARRIHVCRLRTSRICGQEHDLEQRRNRVRADFVENDPNVDRGRCGLPRRVVERGKEWSAPSLGWDGRESVVTARKRRPGRTLRPGAGGSSRLPRAKRNLLDLSTL